MRIDPQVKEWVDSYGRWFLEEDALKNTDMKNNLHPYDHLFSPIRINKTTIKNRLVMAPMGNISMCEETGRPNAKMLEYFFARAAGGVGLITTGLVPVSHGIDPTVTEPGKLSYFPRIDRTRTVYAGWRDLAQGVHSFGSRIFIQLTAGLGRVGNPQCLLTLKKPPVSASWNPNFYISEIPSRRLSDRQLKKIVKNMGQAATDAKTAGIDGVYLHGHEGYLLEQMTNPAFNRRNSGRYADWQAFGIDCIKEIRQRVGPDYPIMYRIDLSLALDETYGAAMADIKPLRKFTGGRDIAMTLDYMENLVKAGVDIFDVDLGCYDNWWLPHPPSSMPPGCFLEVSQLVKDHFAEKEIRSNAGQPVPIVAVGKLGYPDFAEQALRDETCDMVMLGRPLLADPEWPNKAQAGRTQDIIPCIGCQEGCINEFVEGGHPQCAVNPRTAFEHEFPAQIPKTDKPLKIGIIGGGPAGVMAAATAARKGHKVTLVDKEEGVGGRLHAGSVAEIKYEVRNYLVYLQHLVDKTAEEYDLTYLPGTQADNTWIKEQGFDKVVYALGTSDATLSVDGAEQADVVQAVELFLEPEKVGDAKSAIVIGGGIVGCEAAYWLKMEKDIDVTVVEMDKYIMNHICTANRAHLIYHMHQEDVRLLNCTRVIGFEGKNKVNVISNISPTIPNPYNTWAPILPENIENPLAPAFEVEEERATLEADLIVMAVGGRPDDALFLEGQRLSVAPNVYNIGDSFDGAMILQATRAGYRLGLEL